MGQGRRSRTTSSASVAGGAAYANRNPLFRSPGGDGDDNDTVYSHGSGSTETPSIEPRMGHQSALSRSGGGVQPSSGGRRALTRSGVELRGAAAFGNTSGAADAARTRLLQKRLGGGEAAGIVSLGNANGAGRSGNGGRQKPRGHVHEADMDDGKGSDMSGMVYLDQPKRPGLRGGVGLGGHGKNISGSGSTVIAGSTSSIGISGSGGGCSGPAMKGQEPAVKTCGCVTTATFLKLVTLVVALYNGAALWLRHYDASTGKLCSFSNRNACVTLVVSKVLLTIARVSAGALFPSIACCVLSKCYATRYFLHHSWLTLIVDLEPTHKLHMYFGVVTLVCSLIHTAAHVARVLYEGDPERLYAPGIFLSGVLATLLLLPVAIPMWFIYMRNKLTYEFRKLMHMLFIPFIVTLCFHSKSLRVMGAILLAWYILDRLYFTTRMTFFISRPIYKAVGRGTLVRFELPIGYQFKPGAYVQVNCPAISASEWHPFSLFPVPGPTARAGFHVEAVGDWTEQLFRLCLEDPRMPLWITAAQPSVLEQTVYYDNVVLVCSGAGITPAVSVAERFTKKKNVHLLWLSREAGMVAMFEKQLRRVKSTVYLTGQPSAKTKKRMIDLLAPSRTEVVAKTASCSSKPNSRASSCSDLTMLEDGALADSTASFLDYRGTFRDDDGKEQDDGQDDASMFGESMLGGSSRAGSYRGVGDDRGDFSKGRGSGSRHRRNASRGHNGRSRGLHPVSLNFGRPNIESFISDTIRGTAVIAEWAGPKGRVLDQPFDEAPPTRLNQALARLNTNQRISKRDLMSADLSVVDSKPYKASSMSSVMGFESAPSEGGLQEKADPCTARKGKWEGTWLVLYCGGNAKIEQAVSNACNELGVTWRKEYFSAW